MIVNNHEEMSLIDHITELRKRLIWSFVYILIIFVICFYFADQLFSFLAYPLINLLDTENGQGFIYTALQEAFLTKKKIAFFLLYDNNTSKTGFLTKYSESDLRICPFDKITVNINTKSKKKLCIIGLKDTAM